MDAASLLSIPSSPAPSGLQIFALFVTFFFPALALIVVSTRAAGRFATNQFGWDDWLVCIAMLMSVAETVISFFCTLSETRNISACRSANKHASYQDKFHRHPR